jgi:hypothetical protein
VNPKPETVKVLVKNLRVGDRLAPTGRVVTAAPYRGVRCKAGQMRIGVDGHWRSWAAETGVRVRTPRPELSGPSLPGE